MYDMDERIPFILIYNWNVSIDFLWNTREHTRERSPSWHYFAVRKGHVCKDMFSESVLSEVVYNVLSVCWNLLEKLPKTLILVGNKSRSRYDGNFLAWNKVGIKRSTTNDNLMQSFGQLALIRHRHGPPEIVCCFLDIYINKLDRHFLAAY